MTDETATTTTQSASEPVQTASDRLHDLIDHMAYQAAQNAPITPYMLNELHTILALL